MRVVNEILLNATTEQLALPRFRLTLYISPHEFHGDNIMQNVKKYYLTLEFVHSFYQLYVWPSGARHLNFLGRRKVYNYN